MKLRKMNKKHVLWFCGNYKWDAERFLTDDFYIFYDAKMKKLPCQRLKTVTDVATELSLKRK